MNSLKLSLLPSPRYDDVSGMPMVERDGFVDDAVVLALMAGPAMSRCQANSRDLALAADDMDFAGWCLSPTLPSPVLPVPPEAVTRRAAAPEIEEPGIGEPHCGNHRWWLAGLAGAFSTLLFTLLLLSLSSRSPSGSEEFTFFPTQPKPKVTAPTKVQTPPSTPELTGVSQNK
jgi:hypothetical protein